MPCYSPLKAAWEPESGKKPTIYSQAKPRPDPLAAGWEPLDLPCNNCTGCRIDRSKEWAARIVHESQMHQENTFITLTYDAENVPDNGSLDKTHFQKFMKRLRKHYDSKEIRYFHCGEYGSALERPHYHACLFGVAFDDAVAHFTTDSGHVTYISETLERIWGKGFCTIGELNYQTAAYTARYIMKKVTGKRAEEHYLRVHPTTGEIYKLEPEYITMSLKPGIGRDFYEKYQSDFFPGDETPIPGKGVYKGVPGYYEKIYAARHPDAYEKIKEARKHYRDAHAADITPARLEQRHTVKKAQLAKLRRQ